VPGDESARSSLQTRDLAGLPGLGRDLIALELHSRIVIGFETLRHADSVSRLDSHCHRGRTTALRYRLEADAAHAA